MTSNIGSDLILSSMAKDGRITTETEELLHKLLRTKFRPEFINRLDEIVFFNALSDADMHGIVDLLIADLAKRLQANRLNLSVSESAKAAIIKTVPIRCSVPVRSRDTFRGILNPCLRGSSLKIRPRKVQP